jgi:hypothetical protein
MAEGSLEATVVINGREPAPPPLRPVRARRGESSRRPSMSLIAMLPGASMRCTDSAV